MTRSPVKISVIVCTYKRPQSLKDILQALIGQSISSEWDFEIVIIDNNSQDNTAEVVAGFSRQSPCSIRYFLETKQGLSFARNRGIREAAG